MIIETFLEQWKNGSPVKGNIVPLGQYPAKNNALLETADNAHSNFIGGMVILGDYLITSSEDNRLKIWHQEDLELVKNFGNQYAPVNHLALSPDGRFLAAPCDDYKIHLYETDQWTKIGTLEGHNNYVSKAAFNAKGDKIISISKDGTVKVWDFHSQTLLYTLEGHQEWVYALAVHPTEDIAITTALNSSAKVWDIAEGTLLKDLVQGSYLGYVMGMTIGGDNTTDVGNKEAPNTIIWLKNGYVVSCAKDIVVWDSRKHWQIVWQKTVSNQKIKQIKYIEEKELLIAVSEQIQGFDINTGGNIFTEKGHDGEEIYSQAIDGNYLYTGDKKGIIKKWDIDLLIMQGKNMTHTSPIYDLYYNPPTQRIFTSSYYASVIAWNENAVPLNSYSDFENYNTKIQTNTPPKNPIAAIVAYQGGVQVIDTQSLDLIQRIRLDNHLIGIEKILWRNEEECILCAMSYKPRLINIRTQEVKILNAPYCFYKGYEIGNDKALFITYTSNLLDKPNEQGITEIEVMANIAQTSLSDIHAPMVLFNLKTLQVEREFVLNTAEFTLGEKDKLNAHNLIQIDAQTIMAYYRRNTLIIWDLYQNSPSRYINIDQEEYLTYYFIYQEQLFVKGKSNYLYVYNTETWECEQEIALPQGNHFTPKFFPEKARFLFANDTYVGIYNLNTFQLEFYEDLGVGITAIHYEDDKLFLGTKTGQLFTFKAFFE
ncbi:MAG: WD40 repeat domain-containing protein [Cytophagales bacterium]|nr:MAG: WD40 repeat domain-containing protein [Cytophagales bacterium]